MASAEHKDKAEQRDDAPRTLGDVLYADKRKAAAPEEDWAALHVAIAAGDQRALCALFQRTHRLVYTLSVRITGNRETAEELTVDVFHDIWRRASTYDAANGSVIGWIMMQARSRALDRVRFEQRKKRVNRYPEDARTVEEVGPCESLEIDQQARVLRAALASLTADERKAIETAFFSELSHAQAAARLNEPLGTVKTRIRSGLMKLRTALRGLERR